MDQGIWQPAIGLSTSLVPPVSGGFVACCSLVFLFLIKEALGDVGKTEALYRGPFTSKHLKKPLTRPRAPVYYIRPVATLEVRAEVDNS